MTSAFPATASSSFLPPPPHEQPTKAARACLHILQAAATHLPMHVQEFRQLVREEKTQAQDDGATVTHTLQTLREALDDVLEQGGSSESTKRKRADSDHANEIAENLDATVPTPDLTPSTISTAPSTACAQVLQSKPGHLLTCIIGWLFSRASHLAFTSGAGPDRTCQQGMPTYVLLAAACRGTSAFGGSEG